MLNNQIEAKNNVLQESLQTLDSLERENNALRTALNSVPKDTSNETQRLFDLLSRIVGELDDVTTSTSPAAGRPSTPATYSPVSLSPTPSRKFSVGEVDSLRSTAMDKLASLRAFKARYSRNVEDELAMQQMQLKQQLMEKNKILDELETELRALKIQMSETQVRQITDTTYFLKALYLLLRLFNSFDIGKKIWRPPQ